MALGRKRSGGLPKGITGADLVIAMAAEGERRGLPYADDFAQLLHEMLIPSEIPLARPAIAQSELEVYEKSPFLAVASAAQAAADSGDVQALKEVAIFGADALSRWQRYLMAGAARHPAWTHRADVDYDV